MKDAQLGPDRFPLMKSG